MPRIARVVFAAIPDHVTQGDQRRQQAFFTFGDYLVYPQLMVPWCTERSMDAYAYCLMPNRVHLIVVAEDEEGLGRAIRETHRRHTAHVNFRESCPAHLWQGRFVSSPIGDPTRLLRPGRKPRGRVTCGEHPPSEYGFLMN